VVARLSPSQQVRRLQSRRGKFPFLLFFLLPLSHCLEIALHYASMWKKLALFFYAAWEFSW
jgi:hypothetical protein